MILYRDRQFMLSTFELSVVFKDDNLKGLHKKIEAQISLWGRRNQNKQLQIWPDHWVIGSVGGKIEIFSTKPPNSFLEIIILKQSNRKILFVKVPFILWILLNESKVAWQNNNIQLTTHWPQKSADKVHFLVSLIQV